MTQANATCMVMLACIADHIYIKGRYAVLTSNHDTLSKKKKKNFLIKINVGSEPPHVKYTGKKMWSNLSS